MDVIDRAAGGVAAEQGTLGALEYFHPVDIEHREGLALGNGDITLVQVDRIGRLDNIVEVVLGDAANGELGVLAGDVAAGMDPGVNVAISKLSCTPIALIWAPVKAVTTTGTSCRFSSRFWAVTVTSSRIFAPSAGCRASALCQQG